MRTFSIIPDPTQKICQEIIVLDGGPNFHPPYLIHYRDTLSNNSINMKIMHVFMISLHWSLVLDVSLMTTVVLKHQSP